MIYFDTIDKALDFLTLKKDQRKRLARPKTLIIFGLIFLIFPVINYFNLCSRYGIKYYNLFQFIRLTGVTASFLTFFPVIVGIGLLNIKKWGFWLFLFYAPILIFYNLYTIIKSPIAFNVVALLQAVIGTYAVYYFTRKDISAPYMKMYPRGWRMQKRNPVALDALLNGEKVKTIDISSAGMYVEPALSEVSVNEEVDIQIEIGGQSIHLKAGVVRIDPGGLGLALRGVNRDTEKLLESLS
ncbi:MAG: PilZ domain-containing protein [Leptospira sp.]|nr:PilZ domain-containing protein [Leptospira sp.]